MSILPIRHRQSGSCAGLATLVVFVTVLAPFLRGAGSPAAPEPLRLHPENSHYLLWQGKPTVLITSGEHYGAVLNLDFNYLAYLDELARHRFNLTRIFSGTYREVPGSFNIIGNTLAPAAGRFVCPWVRSQTPGAADGGNKFDLTQWDHRYFARLKDFIRQAGQRGVVVELVFFCTMYDDKLWEASPMHVRNNVNGVGGVSKYEVFSAKDRPLFEAQQAVVRKLVTELNAFDNLYYEVCNEPYERGGLTKKWNDGIIATIVEAEATLPNKHLIAQGFPPSSAGVADLNPRISILNFHAAKPAAVQLNYHHHRVIAFDETGGSDRSDRKYRTEGWEWLLAGGGVYDHLDFSFTTDRPEGTAVPLPPGTPGGGGPELRRQLRVLKEFMEGFDFIRMAPHDEIIKTNRIAASSNASRSTPTPTLRALAEIGKAYAIYINGGTRADLELDLPGNNYLAEWVNPKSGQIEKAERFSHVGGSKAIASPVYSEDIALRILRRATNEVSTKATGPLRPHPTNPRYFADGARQPDGSLKAVYLTGSHTWPNLIDRGPSDPPPAFDFSAYLEFLQKHHHNFIRLWSRHVGWYHDYGEGELYAAPLAWMRTGPGIALDGKLKFDLTKLNPAYFDRLRKRVTAAGDSGIYVAIMLFGGHYECHGGWRGSPFHAHNNINGINGDPSGDGVGLEAHTLAVPAITLLQETYVRKVIDTVNDCDNVLYEIANEADEATVEWQYHLIRFIHRDEAGKPRQHPVGMTALWTDNAAKGNQALAASPADWIAPHTDAWDGPRNVPANGSTKVSFLDSDHWFVKEIYRDPALGRDWVWRAFCRGHNPILMEHLPPLSFQDRDYPLTSDDPGYIASRGAMGQTRRMAERMNLAAMTPRGELASSGYCLANPGKEYLVFVPGGGDVTVDLTTVSGTLAVEWLPLAEEAVTQGTPVPGGAKRTLRAPFAGDAAIYLKIEPPRMERKAK